MPDNALTLGAVQSAVVRYLQFFIQYTRGNSGTAEHVFLKQVLLDRRLNQRLVLLNSKCFIVFWNGVWGG